MAIWITLSRLISFSFKKRCVLKRHDRKWGHFEEKNGNRYFFIDHMYEIYKNKEKNKNSTNFYKVIMLLCAFLLKIYFFSCNIFWL